MFNPITPSEAVCVTRLDLVCGMKNQMSELDELRAIFAAIEELAGEDNEVINDLAKLGRGKANMANNDLDSLHERVKEAGIQSEVTNG